MDQDAHVFICSSCTPTSASALHAGDTPPRLRAWLLLAGSLFASYQGAYNHAKELAGAALALRPALGTSAPEVVSAYSQLGVAEHLLGNPERAVEVYQKAEATARAAGHERALASILNNLGLSALEAHDFTRARPYLEESIAVRSAPEPGGQSCRRALRPRLPGAGRGSRGRGRRTVSREPGPRPRRALYGGCRVAVEGLASIALERHAPAEATRLLAATTRPRAELAFGESYNPIGDQARAETLDAAQTALGEAAFATAQAEGQALSIEDAADAAALVQ